MQPQDQKKKETPASARYDDLPSPSHLLGTSQKFATVDEYLVYWYREYANNRSEIDSGFRVIGEKICQRVAASPECFEGASILRTYLVRALFSFEGKFEIERGVIHTPVPGETDLPPPEEGEEETSQSAKDLYKLVQRVNFFKSKGQSQLFVLEKINVNPVSELGRLNRWIGGEVSSVNHLLRIYVFLTYLKSKEVLYVLNRATERLKKAVGDDALFPGSSDMATTRRMLEYIDSDRRQANLLLSYLKNGAGENTKFAMDQCAKDQLYRLDLWDEQWKQREMFAIFYYRFKHTLGDKVRTGGIGSAIGGIFSKKTDMRNLSLVKTDFDVQKQKLQQSKVRLLVEQDPDKIESTKEGQAWVNFWQQAMNDFTSFTYFAPSPSEDKPVMAPTLSEESRTTGDDMLAYYKDISDARTPQWTEQRVPWDNLLSGDKDKKWALFPYDCHKRFLSKLGIDAFGDSTPDSSLPSNLKTFQKDYVLEAKVDEFLDEVKYAVEQTPPVHLGSLERSLDCERETEETLVDTDKPFQTPGVHLSYSQVSLVHWLYKYLYLADSRANTWCLSDDQFRFMNNVFLQKRNVILPATANSLPRSMPSLTKAKRQK